MTTDRRGNGSPVRVLLVEDNELDARMMIRYFTNIEAEFEVTRVGDLASAIARLDAEEFDCLLLDLSLPDSSGLMSVEVLTARVPACPIVVLTGLDDPSTALQAVEQGAQDYLSKQTATPETIARSISYAVARLHSEMALHSATDQLALLRDRERIARDLHDTVIQQLFATGMSLQSLVAGLEDGETKDRVIGAVEGIDAAISELREAIFGLHAVPRNIAIAHAVEDVAEDVAEALGFMPIVEVGSMPEDLSPTIQHEAIQIISEALSNVARHAGATATKVVVETDDGVLVVSVTDNGRGIGASGVTSNDDLTGHGLVNMAERASQLAGRFHLGPGPGGGTRIEWRVPLN
ncbi:MAG: response regulator, partial [Acidimicrobiales bacterium]